MYCDKGKEDILHMKKFVIDYLISVLLLVFVIFVKIGESPIKLYYYLSDSNAVEVIFGIVFILAATAMIKINFHGLIQRTPRNNSTLIALGIIALVTIGYMVSSYRKIDTFFVKSYIVFSVIWAIALVWPIICIIILLINKGKRNIVAIINSIICAVSSIIYIRLAYEVIKRSIRCFGTKNLLTENAVKYERFINPIGGGLVLIALILAIATTLNKSNSIKIKSYILVGVVLISMFTPIFMQKRSGGTMELDEKRNESVVNVSINNRYVFADLVQSTIHSDTNEVKNKIGKSDK